MNFFSRLPENWRILFETQGETAHLSELASFVEREYRENEVFPPEEELFSAFRLTLPEKVRVVILGQDPYHEKGQAHGLAFSVKPGVKMPPSLRNIFKERQSDLGIPFPGSGSLVSWAEQGVFLLNTVLTVRAGTANSHAGCGWEDFTDTVIRLTDSLPQPIVYLLWGASAQKKAALIKKKNHLVLCAAHPSPFSAYRGFFGSRPFSRANRFLEENGEKAVCW